MMPKKYTYLSYNQIALKIDGLVPMIRAQQYDALVIIVRGGTFPGIHLSVRTGLPIYYLSYERKQFPPVTNWIGFPAPRDAKILLVEDMAGAGKTLISCRQFLQDQEYDVETFVVFKDTMSASQPDWCCYESDIPGQTFLLPWEKSKMNPVYDVMDKSERFVDHELEFTVWNMNCVLDFNNLDDEMTLLEKGSISKIPSFQEQDQLMANGIREANFSVNWMKQNDVTLPLNMVSDTEGITSALRLALLKGDELLMLGCTRYVDNDVESLVLIGDCFPHLEVLWWNNGNPISLISSSLVH